MRSSSYRRTGQDTSRLQGFSDGVFALSATLLVVTLGEVPSSYDQLLASVARFPAFTLAFAALVSLWNNHREFFPSTRSRTTGRWRSTACCSSSSCSTSIRSSC